MGELSDEKVVQYLKANPQNVDLAGRRRVIMENGDDQDRMMFELAVCCGQLLNTEAFDLAVNKEEGTFLVYRKKDDPILQTKKMATFRRAPAHVQKLVDCADRSIGEIVFYTALSEYDKQLVNIICTWACSSLHYAQMARHFESNGELFESFARQRKLSSFLLEVAKSIFQDIVSMDSVILKVMNYAQKLVDADRASLFLVDAKDKQLYARIFDVGQGEDEHIKINQDGQKEIRFEMSRGIAGHVATSGQGLNIENAYDDPRFNKDVDEKTGYRTSTILCMPIFIRGHVIGVVQMVNKHDGVFNKADEDAFEIFAVYCGLALHHAKLYDKIRRSEQKHRVALEVLAYHSVSNRDEVAKLKRIPLPETVPQLETFDFNGMRLSELEKPLYAVYMFRALFKDTIAFDTDDLIRFVLTVRKNYRRVAYHNWAHGWSVAHAMFVLLWNTAGLFTPTEALALYVGCLCHDLDHRGKNNAYMKTMSTPLASIYSTSVMEHHHFNQTVTILQQDGHNILRSMTSQEYKRVLSLIKHCILATDLALFFPNKARLNKLIEDGKFDIRVEEHRLLTQSVLMTGCDLIASAKPWQIQTETVKVIFEEFYEQGDAERLNGREPIAMMDRTKAHELPQMQVGFMRGICVPCYDVIAKVIPETKSLKERCEYNAMKWEELADEQRRREANGDVSPPSLNGGDTSPSEGANIEERETPKEGDYGDDEAEEVICLRKNTTTSMKQSRSVSLGRTGTTTELSSRDTQPTTNTLESTVETPSRHAHHLQPRKIVPTSTEELLVYKRIKRGLTRPSIDDETLESPSDWGTPLQLQMQKSQQQRRKASRSTYSRGREQRSMPKEGRSRPSNNMARKTAPRAPVSAKTPQTPLASPSRKERESKVEESAKNKSESSVVRTSKTLSSHSRSGAGVVNTPRAITPMELSAAIRKEGALAHEKDKLLSAEKIKQSMRNRQLKKDENKKNEELKNPNPSTYIPSDNKEKKENDGDKRLTKEVFVHEKAPPFSPMKLISEEEGTSPPGEEPKKSKPDESLGKKDQHKAKGEDPKDERGQQLDKKDSKAGDRNDRKERECKEQESGKKRDVNGESKAVDRNNRKERECREQESGKKKDVKGESKAGEQRNDRKERECREQESGKKKDFKIENKAGERNERKERECREQESGKKKDFKFEIKAAERNDKREGKEQESGKKKEKEDTDQKKKKEKAPKDVEEQKNTKNDKENVKNDKEPPDSDIN